MNGLFTHQPKKCFPPSDSIFPVFWGFHISDWNDSWDHFLSPDSLEYLKQHEPIGCRDLYTTNRLRNAGINTFYSKCLTLIFPRRKKTPLNGWNIVVDVPIDLPPFIKDSAIYISHKISPYISEKDKIDQAKKILSLYKSHAKMVITTRLHCALPCVSMGIPVIFLGKPNDYRISINNDIGIKIYNLSHDILSKGKDNYIQEVEKIWKIVDWEPQIIDFEEEKLIIIEGFKKFLERKLSAITI